MPEITIEQMSGIAIAIVILAIVIGIGATILSTMQTSAYLSTAEGNESINFALNNTEYATAHLPLESATVYNDTDHLCAYSADRYAVTTTGITIYTNGTTRCPNMTTGVKYVDYAWTNQGTMLSTTMGYGVTGIGTIAAWIPTIAVIISAAIVLGIIIKYFRE